MDFLGDLGRFLRRCLARLRRGRLDDELRDEIEQHIALRREQLVDAGMDPEDAACEARRRFGNPLVIREDVRRLWSLGPLDTLVQDVRFSARVLRRTPLFSATAVLSLAFGIGASASVFSVADAVLFRRLPVADPHELHSFRAIQSIGAATKIVGGVDEATFIQMQQHADFAQVAGTRLLDNVGVGVTGESGSVRVELVSANYFDLLGARAAAGRLEGEAASIPMVLSERLWRSTFRRDPNVVGRAIHVNGHQGTVIGVVDEFRGLSVDHPADIFLPLESTSTFDRSSERSIRLVLRRAAGVSAVAAEHRAAALFESSATNIIAGARVRVELPSAEHGVSEMRGRLARPLGLGLALVGILVLVASANTGGLLLSRLGSRRAEFAVRIAIGAGRGRLARQLIVEVLWLGLCAAVLGLLAAFAGGPLLVSTIPSPVPLEYDLRVDWRLVGFGLTVSAIAAVAAAMASVIRLLRTNTAALLSSEGRTILAGSRRATSFMIGAQVGCTMLLLVGAAAVTRTLVNLHGVPTGFATNELFSVDLNTGNERAARDRLMQLLDRVSASPLVANATVAQFAPMVDGATTGTVTVRGFAPATDEDRWVRMYFVGPRYFETLGMPLLSGRDVRHGDRADGERVAVVNDRFAKFYFGTASNAIDRVVNGNVRIVGVVADAQYDSLRQAPARAMFVPFTQAPPRARMTLLIRARSDRAESMQSVVETLREDHPAWEIRATTGNDWVSMTLARERFIAGVALVLSTLAVFLAGAGLYAAVADSISQRRAEVAVRLALGAPHPAILRLVLLEPVRTTAAGIAAALPVVLLMMPSVSWLLFEVPRVDVAATVLCGGALLAVAVVATIVPALRATRIDPAAALKIQ